MSLLGSYCGRIDIPVVLSPGARPHLRWVNSVALSFTQSWHMASSGTWPAWRVATHPGAWEANDRSCFSRAFSALGLLPRNTCFCKDRARSEEQAMPSPKPGCITQVVFTLKDSPRHRHCAERQGLSEKLYKTSGQLFFSLLFPRGEGMSVRDYKADSSWPQKT